MKVRWSSSSVRLRITPSELQQLERGQPVLEEFMLPGSGCWSAEIRPRSADTTLTLAHGHLVFYITEENVRTLSQPYEEGVYFRWKYAPQLSYFIEKDYPCAHPRAADANEAATETFVPPAGFEERKQHSAPSATTMHS